MLALIASLPQEADRNARELVAEEERVKRKAEKKKLKKKVIVSRRRVALPTCSVPMAPLP